MGEKRNVYKIFVGIPEETRAVGRPRHRRKVNMWKGWRISEIQKSFSTIFVIQQEREIQEDHRRDNADEREMNFNNTV
jgi:AAA15 family ATPase/GTPase